MPSRDFLRCLSLASGLIAFVVASWLGSTSLGEPPVPVAAAAGAADAGRSSSKYQGTGDCNQCHEKPTKREIAEGTTKFFEMTELATWEEKDKHALAYKVLKNSRSRKMAELLGIKSPETDASCLSCHAVNVDASQCAEGNVLRVQQEGVSCEACHGPASNWVDDHWHPNKWRNKMDLTRNKKTDRGFVDLRDAATRAGVCLSCHVGNAQEGKVVT